MNSLSWLIYLAEVSGNLRDAAGVGLFVVSFAATLAAVSIGLISVENKIPSKRSIAALTAAFAFFMAVFSVTLIVAPSPATVYMIAASEAGEVVANSPQARSLLESLREIIARKLKAEIGEVRT